MAIPAIQWPEPVTPSSLSVPRKFATIVRNQSLSWKITWHATVSVYPVEMDARVPSGELSSLAPTPQHFQCETPGNTNMSSVLWA